MRNLNLKAIRLDGGTQSRVALNEPAVADYALVLAGGVDLPPIVVFNDGVDLWLADGFHRWHAYNRDKRASIPADVRDGTRREALLFALGANQSHGLRRTNEDKRKAVLGMLDLVPEWSDNRIAKHVGVSDKTVAAHRASIFGNSEDAPTTRTVERNGLTYQQDTSGQRQAAKERAAKPATATATATASTVTAEQRAPGVPTVSVPAADAALAAAVANEAPDDDADLQAGQRALEDAAVAFSKAMDCDDAVGELAREVKRLTLLNAGLQSRIDGLMNEKNAAIAKVRSLERKLAALEKAGAVS